MGALSLTPLLALRAQGTAVLYGSVRDSAGRPLRATIRVVNGHEASAADGAGRFRLSVPAGLTIVRVAYIGFQSVDDTVALAAGDSLERDYRPSRGTAGGPIGTWCRSKTWRGSRW